jgi:hypothetical protein
MRTLERQVVQCGRAGFRSWDNMVDVEDRGLPDLQHTAINASVLITFQNRNAKQLWNRRQAHGTALRTADANTCANSAISTRASSCSCSGRASCPSVFRSRSACMRSISRSAIAGMFPATFAGNVTVIGPEVMSTTVYDAISTAATFFCAMLSPRRAHPPRADQGAGGGAGDLRQHAQHIARLARELQLVARDALRQSRGKLAVAAVGM